MKTFVSDRRLNRSEEVHAALALQLAASSERANFSAMVLADDLGLAFAIAGNRNVCEQMAALCPILAHDMKTWHGTIKTNRGTLRLSVAPIRVDNALLYLSAAEGKADEIAKEIFTSGRGVSRILT